MNITSFLRFWTIRRSALFLMLIALLLPASQLTAAEPTKEDAVKVLRSLLRALEENDYAKAATFFKLPTGTTEVDWEKDASKFIQYDQISTLGIDRLETKGKWEKMANPKESLWAERFTERFGVAAADCYALWLEGSLAGFYRNGTDLKVIQCSVIGKQSP